MTDWAIEVEGLGKRYRLGVDGSRQRLGDLFMPWRRGADAREFWALRDISFKIERGESVGIIGRNGAGKSTLLKILSRITAPTEGRLRVNGRVGTLLEVGTGFHPELSGRENVFLSGAILGLSRAEISSKFDEIVEFSEVEKFIETPVKRYSSGMQVRLAFAVALYLDPEILIVDEVLAVGDLGFQRKSVGKLRDAATSDHRTILFVSHSLESVKRLCPRIIVLDGGQVKFDGPSDSALSYYRESFPLSLGSTDDAPVKDEVEVLDHRARVLKIEALDAEGKSRWSFRSGETARIRFEFEVLKPVPELAFVFRLLGQPHRPGIVDDIITEIHEPISAAPLPAGYRRRVEIELPNLKLRSGEFWLHLRLADASKTARYGVSFGGLPPLSVTSDAPGRYERMGLVSVDYDFHHEAVRDPTAGDRPLLTAG